MKKLLIVLCIGVLMTGGLALAPKEVGAITYDFRSMGLTLNTQTFKFSSGGYDLWAKGDSDFLASAPLDRIDTFGLGVRGGGLYHINNYNYLNPGSRGGEYVIFTRPDGASFESVTISAVRYNTTDLVAGAIRIMVSQSGLYSDAVTLTTEVKDATFNATEGDLWTYTIPDAYEGYNYLFIGAPSTGAQSAFRIADLTVNPVPEPATMFLLGSGLIGVGAFVRRKFKK